MERADWRYYVDFFLFPPAAVLIAILYARSIGWWTWFAGGFLLWTFAEYWTHRTLLHVMFWHGTHERHHRRPAEYVVFPAWQTAAIFAGFIGLFLMLPASIFCGFVAGYSWFLAMHHWLHHVDLAAHPWLQRYAIWHNRHHRLGNCNYGITTPIWDVVFGTSR